MKQRWSVPSRRADRAKARQLELLDKERARLAEQSTAIGNLQTQREKIAAL